MKPTEDKVQYGKDYITKSFRLDLNSDMERKIAKFLESLPNSSQFIKVMICNTNLFEKWLKEVGDDFYGEGASGKYGFTSIKHN